MAERQRKGKRAREKPQVFPDQFSKAEKQNSNSEQTAQRRASPANQLYLEVITQTPSQFSGGGFSFKCSQRWM